MVPLTIREVIKAPDDPQANAALHTDWNGNTDEDRRNDVLTDRDTGEQSFPMSCTTENSAVWATATTTRWTAAVVSTSSTLAQAPTASRIRPT